MGLTTPSADELVGWTPIRLEWTDNEPIVDWCYTDGEQFDDPCFDQTIERCFRRPSRLLFRHRTTMATLGEVAAAGDTLPLAGIVAHSSRCGSTLVAQMLAHLPSTLVMAEAAPLQSVLEARSHDPTTSDDQIREWLRCAVAVLGRRRRPEQRHLVIKLDAWAMLYFPLIREAFPTKPWIFLYRDPIEVLVSQLRHRGYHMIPGCLPPHLLGSDSQPVTELAPEEYMAVVLGALLAAAARLASSPRCLLVNYGELPSAVQGRIAPWFGIDIEAEDIAALRQVAEHDAKNPSVAYSPHSVAQQEQATAETLDAARRWAYPHYEVLEARRGGRR